MNNAILYRSQAGMREVMNIYDNLLATWPVPRQEMNITTRHGDTFVIASGDPAAPPLVLLHGTCSNAVSWIGEITEYSRHHRVFAVDIIGEPGRSAPSRPDWKGVAYVEWLEDVLDGLSVRRASLAGVS